MCKVFYYKNYHFDTAAGVLSLHYGTDGKESFCEQVVFPGAPFSFTPEKAALLQSVFRLAHIACGISYYKAFLPPEIVIEGEQLTVAEAAFFQTFYEEGLGEFSVLNNLDLSGKIHFPAQQGLARAVGGEALLPRALVPVGGGKDSCLTAELLKRMRQPVTAVSCGSPRPIQACVRAAAVPALVFRRILDKRLLELNKSGAVYNGHVPITGILAFLLWACTLIYDYRYVVMSCERSANSGNMRHHGKEVNHQYSKSFAFERAFAALTRSITPAFRYFSLLRPLSEIHIAALFSRLCGAYFPIFTSCNKAFRLDAATRLEHWCGQCDKCRFVFLILAPFMDKGALIQAVGHNPLDDAVQTDGYRALLGLSGHKPFECVGEIDESRWAFARLAALPQWQDARVIRELKPAVQPPAIDPFAIGKEHLIPEEFTDVMALFKL